MPAIASPAGSRGLGRQAELLRTGIRTLGGALAGVATVGGLAALVDRSLSVDAIGETASMSDTQPIDPNSASLGIGRHVSGIADPFNGHIDEVRIAHVQRSDGWIETNSDERGRVARSACYGAGGLAHGRLETRGIRSGCIP